MPNERTPDTSMQDREDAMAQGDTPASSASGTEAPRSTRPDRERRDHVQEQLDDALADSFPASDPVSNVTSQTPPA